MTSPSSPFPAPRLLALALDVCDLCEQAPGLEAGPMKTVLAQDDVTRPPRPVPLCEPCRTGRPGRASAGLEAADVAWYSLSRECGQMLDRYRTGQWAPYRRDTELAVDLARTRWTEAVITAAIDRAPYDIGLTAGLLTNALRIIKTAGPADSALRPLRVLIDALADDASSLAQPDDAPNRTTTP